MSYVADRDAPCWEVAEADGSFPDWDYFPHYKTKAAAEAAIREDYPTLEDADRYKAVQRLSKPCVEIKCDGCDATFDANDANHFDPDDGHFDELRDADWLEKDGKHWCGTDCLPGEFCPLELDGGHEFEDGECVECGRPDPAANTPANIPGLLVQPDGSVLDQPLFGDL